MCRSTEYRCISRECVEEPDECVSFSPVCSSLLQTRYWCPNERLCRSRDSQCLRTCGYNQSGVAYSNPCPSFPNLCAINKRDCPEACTHPAGHRCPNGDCVQNENYCIYCPYRRCADSGACFGEKDECNNVAFCVDSTDEVDCNLGLKSAANSFIDPWIVALLIGAGIFMFIIFLICACRMSKRGQNRCCCRHENSQCSVSVLETTLAGQISRLFPPVVFEASDIFHLYQLESDSRLRRENTGSSVVDLPPSYNEVVKRNQLDNPEDTLGLPTYEEAVSLLETAHDEIPP